MAAAAIAAFWLSGTWATAQNTWGARTISAAEIQAGNVILKAGSGTLRSITVVEDNGATPILIYDNASLPNGVVVAVVPANAKAGDLIPYNTITNNQVGYTFGLVIAMNATAGAITVQF
jgi:uncharacterized membrane-anchored protein